VEIGGAVSVGGLFLGIGGAADPACFEGLTEGGTGVLVGIFGAD